jgi:hypothetical protein
MKLVGLLVLIALPVRAGDRVTGKMFATRSYRRSSRRMANR